MTEGRFANVMVVDKRPRAARQRLPVDPGRFARLARAVMVAEGRHPETELSVVIGDDAWIQELNQEYLSRKAPTDVLAFPQDARGGAPPEPPEGEPLLGDVVISAETAARQAEGMGHPFEEEMAILLAHGILHLTGWQDETAPQRRRMMRRVNEVLAQLPQDLGS